MRAIVMTAFGGPEVLRLTDIPEPEPEHGQIRVRLYAAGVNPAEAYIRTASMPSSNPYCPIPPGLMARELWTRWARGCKAVNPVIGFL